ncbi:MAG: acetyl-CoA decarbonylase/synthase complex subunit gamma [Clostridia bacterium]
MALNGLQIQKILPKTNCKECGSNTCMAFAMKLAAKKADLSECPYASDEAKALLGADSEPPVKPISLGANGEYKIGDETVLYRHEKTFVNQTLIAINVNDADLDDATGANGAKLILEKIRDYKLERVGEILTVNAIAVTQTKNDGSFLELAKLAVAVTGLPLIIRSKNESAIEAVASAVKGTNSVIVGVNKDNAELMVSIAQANGHALAISGDNVDEVYALAEKLKADGFNNLILDFGTQSVAEAFQINSIARRAALKDKVKPLGYASIKFIETEDLMDATVEAITEIDKYGGIVVLPTFEPAQLVALMTLRLNIYTDPQKPIQVEPKVYAIGEPDRNSAVFVTTNFSLTYFIVSGEIENSGISAWLVIPECDGLSVLTAWAAGKFSGSHIAKFIKEIGLEDMVDTRKITIPGYVSQISGELEENLPGWVVSVGPQEAVDLEAYIKTCLP